MPTYQRTQSLIMALDSDGPVEIYRPSLVNHPDVPESQRHTGYITDLRIKTKIQSIAETPLPEFALGASKTAKLAVVRDLEYFSPRYNLDVLLKYDGGEWLSIFELALHNRQPFFVSELLGYLTRNPAFAVAPDAILGMQFTNVGYGLPDYHLDSIYLNGVVREEYSTPDPPIIIQSVLPAQPSEDIDMADLTPIQATLTLGNSAYAAYGPGQYYSTDISYRLLVWPALKLAHLDFTLLLDYPSQETVILSWDNQYSALAKRIYVPLIFEGIGDQTQPNAWAEVRENTLVYNSNIAEQLNGSVSGTIVFPLAA